jgi:hypothetical protein
LLGAAAAWGAGAVVAVGAGAAALLGAVVAVGAAAGAAAAAAGVLVGGAAGAAGAAGALVGAAAGGEEQATDRSEPATVKTRNDRRVIPACLTVRAGERSTESGARSIILSLCLNYIYCSANEG